MNFYIKKIVLWLNNGQTRELDFLPNKVNVITGNSSTGKSAIIKIIDYVFGASKNSISPRYIGENVKWYGINFISENSNYTIARGAILPQENQKLYYFSDTGEIPILPENNFEWIDLQQIIKHKFSINAETIFAGGARSIKQGSKISFRYFLWLFCFQTQKILSNDEVLFEKQNVDRYRDALNVLRILDWALEIETPKNILTKNKINDLQAKIKNLERKNAKYNSERLRFSEMLGDLLTEAQKLLLIPIDQYEDNDIIRELELLIYSEQPKLPIVDNSDILESLSTKKTEIQLQINNFKKFKKQYEKYHELSQADYDSIRPIEYIKEQFDNIIPNKSTKHIINSLENELKKIKHFIREKSSPFSIDVQSKINNLEQELSIVTNQINNHTAEYPSHVSDKEKYMFLGYVKSKLEIYKGNYDSINNEEIESLESQITELQKSIQDSGEKRYAIFNTLNEYIDKNLDLLKIENYDTCRAYFNNTDKRLDLRVPDTSELYTMPQLGSASIAMNLHLAFFIGLHQLLLKNKSPYVPSFLVLDQISTPYYENAKTSKGVDEIDDISIEDFGESDRDKLNKALGVLNNYITKVKEENQQFQIILLEHIPETLWIEEGFENFHLVDKEFKNGNKLINL